VASVDIRQARSDSTPLAACAWSQSSFVLISRPILLSCAASFLLEVQTTSSCCSSSLTLMTILSGVPSVLHTMALRSVVCEFPVGVVLRSLYSQKIHENRERGLCHKLGGSTQGDSVQRETQGPGLHRRTQMPNTQGA
jgi:hypothetical protein